LNKASSQIFEKQSGTSTGTFVYLDIYTKRASSKRGFVRCMNW